MFYTTLEEMLADGLRDPETFEQADRMYSASFRSEAVKASELFTCTDKEWESDWLLLTDALKKLPVFVDKESSWSQS